MTNRYTLNIEQQLSTSQIQTFANANF